MRLIEHEIRNGDYLLTIERRRLFRKPSRFKVRGSCTVWHRFPGGRRCSTMLESVLANIWETLEWERKDSKPVKP